MTDAADRQLAQHLEGRLHDLAHGAPVPVVAPADDLRRGRRRLLRVRLALAGATSGALGVVLGVTSLTAGDPTATEVPPASRPPSTPVPSVAASSSAASGDTATGGQQGRRNPGGGGAAQDPHPGGTGLVAGTGRLPARDELGGATAAASHSATGATGTTGQHVTSGQPTPTVSTQAPPATPSSTPSGTTSTSPAPDPTQSPTSTPTVQPLPDARPGVLRALREYNDALADHLDAGRDHLQRYDRGSDAKWTTRVDGRVYALGSTFRWLTSGSPLGLRVRVASGWDQLDWGCGESGSGWECRAVEVAEPAVSAEVGTHDGVRRVAVEHADGQVVVLAADAVVGSDAALAAAASDERLTLPGDAPVAPPTLDGADFAAAGTAALVHEDEGFDRTAVDRSPAVRGDWSVGGTTRGTLAWSASPTYSGAAWTCNRAYRHCHDVLLPDVGTVHVARLRQPLGGGWVVEYDGASYAVRVDASDGDYPLRRAFAFVTDPRWQPER